MRALRTHRGSGCLRTRRITHRTRDPLGVPDHPAPADALRPLPHLPLRKRPLTVSRAIASLDVSCGCNSVVECNLAKVEVVGSNPITRSTTRAAQAARVIRKLHS